MTSNGITSHHLDQVLDDEQQREEFLTLEQLHSLVQLLNVSDISELQVKDNGKNARLVLRKAQSPQAGTHALQPEPAFAAELEDDVSAHVYSTVYAHLVGTFHTQGKGKPQAFVAVQDHVTVGQVVGTIQSLGTINEVEAPVAGKIVEILIQDGQLVEYGQPLMTIEKN